MKSTLLITLVIGMLNIAHYSYASEDAHQHETNTHHKEESNTQEAHHDEHDEHDEHEEKPDEGHQHGAEGHEDSDTEGVKLSKKRQHLSEIKVEKLLPKLMSYQVYAPGEIKVNGYTSYLVSPRVDSIVIKRFVALGDHVKKGKTLVTLFSDEVAQAQAAYKIANAEWVRVKKLGRKVMGDKRFVATKINNDAAFAKLKAFGISTKEIRLLTRKKQNLGEYSLSANIDGVVLNDDFHQGQSVKAGDALIELADESTLWIEARLTPNANLHLPVGTNVKFKSRNAWFEAKVTQKAHTIDPQTRTRIVRLLVDNKSHLLHPGLFVDIYFTFTSKEKVLAVPEGALMRGSDGDWVVFYEYEKNNFKSVEVELGRSFGKWYEIKGIEAGLPIVMQGAFFVASEIAKSGFDPHDH